MHGLAGHPVAAGHVGHGGPVEHLAHRLVALLHQSQLHEHERPPSHLRARTTTAKKVATGGWWTLSQARSVVQVPEPVSPRYRSRVREVSGRCRSHSVQHEPEPHTAERHRTLEDRRSRLRNAKGRCSRTGPDLLFSWWRGQDLNLRPSGYEPDELPDCSTPRRDLSLPLRLRLRSWSSATRGGRRRRLGLLDGLLDRAPGRASFSRW